MHKPVNEKLLMHHHGTMRWTPSPMVIYDTARTDLASVAVNARIKNDRSKAKSEGASPAAQGRSKGTAFLYAHLRSAVSVSGVLKAAIKGIRDGQKSKDVATLLVYQSQQTLEKALAIASQKEAEKHRAIQQTVCRHETASGVSI